MTDYRGLFWFSSHPVLLLCTLMSLHVSPASETDSPWMLLLSGRSFPPFFLLWFPSVTLVSQSREDCGLHLLPSCPGRGRIPSAESQQGYGLPEKFVLTSSGNGWNHLSFVDQRHHPTRACVGSLGKTGPRLGAPPLLRRYQQSVRQPENFVLPQTKQMASKLVKLGRPGLDGIDTSREVKV